MDCIVRPENPADYARVHEINHLAFETDSEALLVDGLRAEAQPVISLVAEMGDEVVGHILFTPVAIGDTPASMATMGLTPLAVHPEFQDHGVGGELVKVGLEACAAAGCEAVVTLGHPEYYARFGFTPAVEQGISYVGSDYDSFFLVKELVPDTLEFFQGEAKFHRLIEEL